MLSGTKTAALLRVLTFVTFFCMIDFNLGLQDRKAVQKLDSPESSFRCPPSPHLEIYSNETYRQNVTEQLNATDARIFFFSQPTRIMLECRAPYPIQFQFDIQEVGASLFMETQYFQTRMILISSPPQ